MSQDNPANPAILSKTDRPASVRHGEELPLERLSAYLNEHITSIEQFPSGFSNLTYLIRAGDRELGEPLARAASEALAARAGRLDHWGAVVDVLGFDLEVGIARALELAAARL